MPEIPPITRRRALGYGAATAAGAALASTLTAVPARAVATGVTVAAADDPSVTFTAAFDDVTALYVAPAAPELVVTIASKVALTGTVSWKVLAHGTESAGSGRSPVTVAAGGSGTVRSALGPRTPDFYAVQVDLADSTGTTLATRTLGLGVLHPPTDGLRPGSSFGLGLRGESDPVITKRIAQRMGAKWTRGISAIWPDAVCTAPGKFWDQAAIDKARNEVAEWRSYGIEPIGFIAYNMWWNVTPGPNGEPLKLHQNKPLDLNAHVEMTYRAIAPMQDLVKNWEIWNEPWVHGWTWKTGDAQDYRDLTKRTWDRVKADFPDVNLIGGGSVPYQRDVVYAKGSKDTGYIDGSVNHAYGVPDPVQYALTKVQIKMDKLWSKSNGRAGQWQTELGTAADSFPGLPLEEVPYAVARTLAPTYLLHLLAGAEEDSPMKVFWFSLSYDKGYSGDTFNIYDAGTKTPRPAVVAYSAMTSRLEDSRMLRELYPDARSTWGFLFEDADGHGRAALYSVPREADGYAHPESGYRGTLTLPDARGVKVYDYLGRELSDGRAPQVTLPVNPWEVLYFDSDRSPEQLATALTRSAHFDYDTPLDIRPLSFTRPIDASGAIEVRVENVTPQPVSAVLGVQAPAGWVLRTQQVEVDDLQPGEVRTVRFPVVAYRNEPSNKYLITYEAKIAGAAKTRQSGEREIQLAYAPYRQITVGGDVSQWAGIAGVSVANTSASGDRKEYRLWSAWDQQFFYVRAVLEDAVHFGNKPFPQDQYSFPFKADSLQLAFDAGAKPDDLLAGDPHYAKCGGSLSHLYVATLAQGGVSELHRQAAPGTNYQTFYPTNAPLDPPLGLLTIDEGRALVTRDETAKTTTYEVAIAWDQLPELAAEAAGLTAGKQVRTTFAFAVADAGTNGHGMTYWTTANGPLTTGCYNFAPFWGTGGLALGGRVDTPWGLGR
ncbi:hypothetical protein [Kribbella sp.]|uniref:hypothetical protein n=1 Tax=Kribbella sp. TaxID=1871183 RepID=UPI002D5D33A3|nr:hypothetical protein [Kribbella sp.]HZX03251.1 hypothetical protein [Kribbella sp.]